jgi:hypothetical protein
MFVYVCCGFTKAHKAAFDGRISQYSGTIAATPVSAIEIATFMDGKRLSRL